MLPLSSVLQTKPSKKLAPKPAASRPATYFDASFLLGLVFDPEDGTDMILRNVS
jgi:hypothetical protein